MAFEFKLPELGENIDSGDIVSVLVNEGDTIQANQNVIEIETDKAVIEVPISKGGKVTKIHVKRGDTVKVGGTVLTLEPSDAKVSAAAAKSKEGPTKTESAKGQPSKAEAKKPQPAKTAAAKTDPAKPKAAPAKAQAKSAPDQIKTLPQPDPDAEADEELDKAPASGSQSGDSRTGAPSRDWAGEPSSDDSNGAHTQIDPAGPAVRRLARELGVDLQRVRGTGAGGRITREDVVAAVRQANAGATQGRAGRASGETDSYGGIRREKLTKIRKTIAANMQRSASTIPHVTNFDDADITELERIRKGSASDYVGSNLKLTMMPFIMKAIAVALKAHPALNASLDMDAGEIIYKEYVNIGVAVDTERGLMVPVIRGVNRMTIPQIAQALSTIGEKARSSQVSIEDIRGGSFTISNLGAIGGTYSTPIINPPEVAILLVGRSRKMPVVVDDKIEIRLMMPLSLSYDHRLVDGATAARFLNEVIEYLEAPGRLLLAP